MRYLASEVPFDIHDGWPDPLAGSTVTASEAGIALGSLLLSDVDWAWLSASIIFTVRIDEHPATDGFVTRHPDGSEDRVEFSIPVVPVVAPSSVLVSSRGFSDWVWETHGSLGRLLVWDGSRDWWLVNEPDLEVQIVCAPLGRFEQAAQPDEPFSWLPRLTDSGRDQVAHLISRYELKPTA